MRLLCNENVPAVLIEALASAGHEVRWVRTERPGIDDRSVLTWARQENRICVIFDKDFGELAANATVESCLGVILLRHPASPLAAWANRLAALISERDDWAGSFAIIEPGRVRMRQLPREPMGRP